MDLARLTIKRVPAHGYVYMLAAALGRVVGHETSMQIVAEERVRGQGADPVCHHRSDGVISAVDLPNQLFCLRF